LRHYKKRRNDCNGAERRQSPLKVADAGRLHHELSGLPRAEAGRGNGPGAELESSSLCATRGYDDFSVPVLGLVFSVRRFPRLFSAIFRGFPVAATPCREAS
jgi:hypothetical protein